MKTVKQNFRLILIALWLTTVTQMPYAQESKNRVTNEYILSFDPDNRDIASVKCRLILKDSTIKMTPWGHPWLQNGWATFISDLKVKSADGKDIPFAVIEKEGWGSWKVDAKEGQELFISYQIDFTHGEHDWNPAGGIDSRPEVTEEAYFLVTKALFIYSPGTEASIVRFETPKQWKIATNWEFLDNNRYYVDSWINLVNNALAIGDFFKKTISNGEMDLIIAMDSKLKDHNTLVINVLKKQLDEFSSIFKGTPDRNYLITMRRADEDDGESFHDSFNQVITMDRFEDRLIIWANTMAHEMFHYWNGANFLVGKNLEDLYWFSEGFTEYYASRSLLRTGVIGKGLYFRKLEHYLSRYFITKKMWPDEKISLVEAGKEKGKNWLLLYGGGATMALYFDIEIRSVTEGKKSLDDVMFYLKERYGVKNERIDNQDLLEAINIVSQSDFTEVFEQFVHGKDSFLNVHEMLLKAGLHLDSFSDEMFISEKETSEKTIFHQIIGQ